jgi:hypothetical protein
LASNDSGVVSNKYGVISIDYGLISNDNGIISKVCVPKYVTKKKKFMNNRRKDIPAEVA